MTEKRQLAQQCPECGNQEFRVPEYICTKCKWQDPICRPSTQPEECRSCFGEKLCAYHFAKSLPQQEYCNCAETTCTTECTRNHTHKGFSCENCKPVEQPEELETKVSEMYCNTFIQYSDWVDFIKDEIRKAEEKAYRKGQLSDINCLI
jgi:hypothetical protein